MTKISILITILIGGFVRFGNVTGLAAYQNNPLYYIEFLEDGIRYYNRGSILKQLRYFKDLFSHKDTLTYHTYQDIEKVVVQKNEMLYWDYTKYILFSNYNL